MEVKRVSNILGGLALLKYFPTDGEARGELAVMVSEILTTEDQVAWLVRRMRNLYNEWPGPQELRAVACSKFKPADGIEGNSCIYLDGIPSEREQKTALPPPDPRSRLLPPGEVGDIMRDLVRKARAF